MVIQSEILENSYGSLEVKEVETKISLVDLGGMSTRYYLVSKGQSPSHCGR